jgi:hypothetical protein
VAGAKPGRVHGADEGEVDGQRARVVAHAGREEPGAVPAHRHVGSFGEDGVEMGGQHQHVAVAEAAAQAHHVADLVLRAVLQPVLAQHGEIGGRAPFLLEGRGGDLGEVMMSSTVRACSARITSQAARKRASARMARMLSSVESRRVAASGNAVHQFVAAGAQPGQVFQHQVEHVVLIGACLARRGAG